MHSKVTPDAKQRRKPCLNRVDGVVVNTVTKTNDSNRKLFMPVDTFSPFY